MKYSQAGLDKLEESMRRAFLTASTVKRGLDRRSRSKKRQRRYKRAQEAVVRAIARCQKYSNRLRK